MTPAQARAQEARMWRRMDEAWGRDHEAQHAEDMIGVEGAARIFRRAYEAGYQDGRGDGEAMAKAGRPD